MIECTIVPTKCESSCVTRSRGSTRARTNRTPSSAKPTSNNSRSGPTTHSGQPKTQSIMRSILSPTGGPVPRLRGGIEADLAGALEVAAECVRQLDLTWTLAVGLEQPRAAHHDAGAARPRGGDVEAVGTIEEIHAARRVLGRRGGHRVDDDRRLLPLEPVHGADPGAVGQRGAEVGDL